MLSKKILSTILLTITAHLTCQETTNNIFQTLSPDVQNYLAKYLPFKGIESDEDLERIVNGKNNAIIRSGGKSNMHYEFFETNKYTIEVYDKELFLIKKNSKQEENEEPTSSPFSSFSSQEKQNLLLSIKKPKSKNEQLPLIGSLVSLYNNFHGSDALVLEKTLSKPKISANGQYLCTIKTQEWSLGMGLDDQCGFYIVDLKNDSQRYIPLPQNFPIRSKKTKQMIEAVSLINEGYSLHNITNNTDFEMVKFLETSAISSDGTFIACADRAGLYLFDISTCKHNQEPPWQQIKAFDTIKINNISTNFIAPIKKIKDLEFNQQCTKLAIAYTQKGEQEVGMPVEFIALGKKEPQKILADYFRQNLILNDLNRTKSKN